MDNNNNDEAGPYSVSQFLWNFLLVVSILSVMCFYNVFHNLFKNRLESVNMGQIITHNNHFQISRPKSADML